jgi:hypothetical protein
MAFMFAWQFLFSGPLEIASAGIGMVQYLSYLWHPLAAHSLAMKLAACLICGLVVLSQYRRIKDVARLTFVLWIAALLTTGWVILSGMVAMNPRLLFDIPAGGLHLNWAFLVGLGKGTVLVIYNYLGYIQVRCLGDEVQRLEPGRGLVFLRRGLAAQEGGSSQKAEPATASHGTQVYGRRDCTAEKDLVGCPR